MPQKVWAVGEEVLAADFNSYVQDQTVPQFPTVAARDATWTAPPNGALCVTTDTNTLWQRIGGAWTVRGGHTMLYYAADPNARNGVGTVTYIIPGLRLAATLLAGHLYEFSARLDLAITVVGGYLVSVVSDAGAEVVRIAQDNAMGTNAGLVITPRALIKPTVTAAGTYNIGIRSVTGALNVNGAVNPTLFAVADLGLAP